MSDDNNKRKAFVPKLYIHAPSRTNDGFVKYIYWFENQRRNSITMGRAGEIFEILRQQSYHAEKEGRHDEVWIKHDPITGEWRGRECATHREGYGLERKGKRGEQSKGETLRKRFGWVGGGGLTRDEFVDVIAATDALIIPEADRVFNTLKAMEIVRFCRVTRLWYGFAADPPNLKTKPVAVSKTQEYRKRYGRMPELTHDWRNLEGSEHLKWIIATEYAAGNEIGLKEAEKIRQRVWKSEGTWKVFGKTNDGRNRICGVDAGLPEGEYTTEKSKPLPKVHRCVEKGDDEYLDYIEGKLVSGDLVVDTWHMPPLEPLEAVEWLCVKIGFRFDALRMLKEDSDSYIFRNGKWRGEFWQSPEEIAAMEAKKKEMLRKEKEGEAEKANRSRWTQITTAKETVYGNGDPYQKLRYDRSEETDKILAPWVSMLKDPTSHAAKVIRNLPTEENGSDENQMRYLLENLSHWSGDDYHTLKGYPSEVLYPLIFKAADAGLTPWSDEHDCRVGIEWLEQQKTPAA